jgi:hypothetical protein
MSTKAQAVCFQFHGEPLTDDDIEESARVTFQMLDNDGKTMESATKERKDHSAASRNQNLPRRTSRASARRTLSQS